VGVITMHRGVPKNGEAPASPRGSNFRRQCSTARRINLTVGRPFSLERLQEREAFAFVAWNYCVVCALRAREGFTPAPRARARDER
jgi:hypothetical protein